MKVADRAFLKRLARLDPQLVLRWAAPRRQWAVERYCLVSDDQLDPQRGRDLFDWNRGRFRAASVGTRAGALVVAREWREVPRHLFWWPGPLGGHLLETLRRLSLASYGSAREAWDATLGARLQAQAQAEADTYRDLREVRADVAQQVRRATGQEVFVGGQ